MQSPVIKRVLSNGLTILIKPSHMTPKVSTQLWYNVGSKDEKTGEKGIAHFIEHMIFKGTRKLSESDINMITHKLSGYTNAFTSYDYTGYLFDFPSQNWYEGLPLLADCMHNCVFKEEHLHSELKAVIQELKMYRDDYKSSIVEALTSAIFADHPYHNPIIGYKQDLWSLQRDSLVSFYHRYYIPNNATLVIVGDVDPEDAAKRAEHEFARLHPQWEFKKEIFYHGSDLKTQSVKLYRDITAPLVILAWVVPGAIAKKDYLIDIVNWVVGSGKGSRLYKKIVDELQLATDLEAFNYDLFDYGVFFLYFQPKKISHIEKIIAHIHEELANIALAGISERELMRAIKQEEAEHLSLLENNQKQAYEIGKFYLATADEQYLYTLTSYPKDHLATEVQDFIAQWMRPSQTHMGSVMPLAESDKQLWLQLQEKSDQEDQLILSRKVREEGVEPVRHAPSVVVHPPKPFTFARSELFYVPKNALKVLWYNNATLPKIDIIIEFTANQVYDPVGKEGLSSFVAALLLEGTKNYTALTFSDTVESYGMSIQSASGKLVMSMLAPDLPKGLELIQEMLVHASFTEEAIEKVRDQMLADLDEFWDSPEQFGMQLAREEVYGRHPYRNSGLGTISAVKAISRDDILNFYKTYITPKGARLAIVGDLERYNLPAIFDSVLGSWQGPQVEPFAYPEIVPIEKHDVTYSVLRDQTVLCYAALSVARMDKDFPYLLIFDQTFTGGVLGSMASRLFDLREQSGLFYTIGGSLLSRSDEQKGLIIIRTIVSNDRRKEAEVAIEHLIDTAAQQVSDDEFKEAQQAIINSLVDNFASNYQMAQTFLFKDKFNLPADYFDTRAQFILGLKKQDMMEVVKKYLNSDRFVLVRVGRY